MDTRSPFTHILVPVDGSDSSISAGKLAIQIAYAHKIPITFIYVVDCTVTSDIAASSGKSVETVGRELERKGRRYLTYMVNLAKAEGLETHQQIRHGVPYREIANAAKEQQASLIVIGKVGCQGPYCGRRVGRVATQVLEYTTCPVMVVRPQPSQR